MNYYLLYLMEQHPVPQNVTTFQFRLIGDMTIKQFGYLAGGIILAYISYKLPLPFFFTWPFAILFALAGFGFAFIPVEERPMDIWVLSFFKNVYSPTQYIWQKTKPAQVTPVVKQAPVTAPGASTEPKIPYTPTTASARASPSVANPVLPSLLSPKLTAPTATLSQQRTPASTVQKHGWTLPHVGFGEFGISNVLARVFQKPYAASERVPVPAQSVSWPKVPENPQPHPTIVSIRRQNSLFSWVWDVFKPKPKPAPAPTRPPHDIFAHLATPSVTGNRMEPMVQAPAGLQQAQVVQTEKLAREAQARAHVLESVVSQLQKDLSTKETSDKRILELQQQLTEALRHKGVLEGELSALRRGLAQRQAPSSFVRPVMPVPSQTASSQPTVRIITPDAAVRAGLPKLTTFPNIVTGITKDTEGNLLPGVLVTVRDKNNVPLRALKTNKLGQFAASTPLPSATYYVEIEDPRSRFVFDRVQITLAGMVMPPIEIVAKSQKELAREKLAREIFGTRPV